MGFFKKVFKAVVKPVAKAVVAPAKAVVKVCVAEACQASGSASLISELHDKGYDIHKGNIKDDIQMEQTFCLGNCALGPAAMVNGVPIGRATCERIFAATSAVTA
jgi:formate dehydrogenase subunit gamma